MMTAHEDFYVTFSPPKTTPKHYIAKGTSGWNETFLRREADAELARLLSPLPVADALDLFVMQRELAVSEGRSVTDWWTVIGFLGRTLGISPKTVPHAAAIAFWAQALAATAARGAN